MGSANDLRSNSAISICFCRYFHRISILFLHLQSMNPIFSRENLSRMYHTTFRRFPLAILLLFIIAGILIVLLHEEITDYFFFRFVVTLCISSLLSIVVSLVTEIIKPKSPLAYQWLVALYGLIFYNYFLSNDPNNTENWILSIMHIFAFIAMIYIVPVVQKKYTDISYSNYITSLSWSILMSLIVWWACLILGYIALYAVIMLFDLSWNDSIEKFFGYWAIISLALVTPIYALWTFPENKKINSTTYTTNTFYAFLVRFIAIPFIIIYFIILYAYSAKVIANFHEWPNGIVSWLVIIFSIFWYVVYFSSRPYEKEYSIVAKFRKYIPWAIIPQIGMLAYALYLRIAQYDLTVNRYFVIIFGLWLLGISLYYIISTRKILLIIPGSLSIIIFLFSIWPWSVYSLPLERQKGKLIEYLKEANMINETQEITPAQKDIDQNLAGHIYSNLSYLCSYDNCNALREIFPQEIADIENKHQNDKDFSFYDQVSSWYIVSKLADHLGINISTYPEKANSTTPYVILDTEPNTFSTLDIHGYESISVINNKYDTSIMQMHASWAYIDIIQEKLFVPVWDDTAVFSLKQFNTSLQEAYTKDDYSVDSKDLITIIENEQYEVKMLLSNYVLKNPNYTEEMKPSTFSYLPIQWYAIIKRKKL